MAAGRIHYGLMLIFLIAGFRQIPAAVTVDLTVPGDTTLTVTIRLAEMSPSDRKIVLEKASRYLAVPFPGRDRLLTVEPPEENPPQKIVFHLNLRQAPAYLNFIDYDYRKSFFKEKYYLKLIMNPAVFQSRIFKEIGFSDRDKSSLIHYFSGDPDFFMTVALPGKCRETNLRPSPAGYYYRLSPQDFQNKTAVLFIRSSRFIPQVSITIYAILLTLILALLFPLFRHHGPAKKH